VPIWGSELVLKKRTPTSAVMTMAFEAGWPEKTYWRWKADQRRDGAVMPRSMRTLLVSWIRSSG
jgi:hypothetical protein